MDDAGPARQHSLPGRMLSFADGLSPVSRHGMKRRASSPPRGAAADPMYAFADVVENRDRRQLGLRSNSCTSPSTSRYPVSHGSISSISSLRTESYGSSTGFSVAASSITSFGGRSPGAMSPTSELETCYEKPYLTPAPHRAQYSDLVDIKGSVSRKGSTQNGISLSKPTAPRIGRLYICECCPKKPKKLESLEELRAHELEKQYTCQFCNKRFKNKNEAERHQNSLHLRRHSWSCAALSNPESAFHPSASPAYQTPNGASHDTCGYCGAEFANFPAPEWERRMDHLINSHKFGECNQAKKFYRADHFRQHLKHSHNGASGKWTNTLESACMKEEAPHEGLPSIGEQPGDHAESEGSSSTNAAVVAAHHPLDEAHLSDRNFCSPIIDGEELAAKKKKEELDREIEAVKREYEEKMKRRREKGKGKEKEKDEEDGKKQQKEDGVEDEEDEKKKKAEKEKDDKIQAIKAREGDGTPEDETPRIYELHRNFYNMRLERLRNMELAKRNRERMKDAAFFPSAPKGDP
ncbi:hypothetical protein LOZ64_005877 [Ophidiomyces ophidiicola]|nr:hypothetical protein LOZ64_005877 [Ophidiomyces ophidiicola]KAI2244615.1 hypothetical protein LOZ13_001399 [Ophidiomyces ophidiicola]